MTPEALALLVLSTIDPTVQHSDIASAYQVNRLRNRIKGMLGIREIADAPITVKLATETINLSI